ncbi:cleavage and polyadenylation specificity factor subunit 1 [Condylostylus longicornis]|uniref:cleavage and polyadenylation specificity factor subunit 1 n=1 Tax=Condylostylus longicornis TaxID=2530218 RepID=UPI00244E45CD|nr:cleavage and polyadenylation specificity factor subunit 1 [Condylostylus longicornis]
MFSICKQIHPATGIEHAISSHFFNSTEVNLVTAGSNILKVYSIRPEFDYQNRKYEINMSKMKLECLAKYTVHGNIMSLQNVSLSGSHRDALLLSFRDAKLSVVQHDPDTYELKTLSLHYFEEDEIKAGWNSNFYIPTVRVDPDNRCAVMLAFGKQLVVLPFRKDNTLDEIELADVKPMKKTPTQLVTKTPILASYIIALKDMDEKIDNVIDFQFLHGYYEPTLLILFEPVRTFSGRIAVRSDTCTLVALSLNIQQRVHPIIWTVTSLPFDCLRVMAIEKPIGGCLVFAVNSLIYLNQSVPPYGVSLNSTADHSTSFPLKPQDGVKISLDAAQITFIDSDKLVLSLKTGELYVLTLCVDSMRSVRNFHFNKAASSVLTSCICVCQNEYIFLGSRLGNSLLLRFREEDENTIITIDDIADNEPEIPQQQPKEKRLRMEEEELEVYGSGKKTSVQLTKFVFEVCDSLLNIGPIGFMTLGARINDSENVEANREDEQKKNNLELITSSGHGKNGALCILAYSIKPQMITSFELPGCIDLWTVFETDKQKAGRKDFNHHDFMILTQKNKTLVLQTGNEINEIEHTGFCTDLPTIYVGNLGNNRFIVQVTVKTIRLLQSTRLIQNIPLDVGSPITQVSLVDPYVCIRAENGQVITLALRETRGVPRLAINKNTVSSTPTVISLSVFKDTSGLFTSKLDDFTIGPGATFGATTGVGYSLKPEPNMKVEDEEDLLYGEGGSSFKMNTMADMAKKSKSKNIEWWERFLHPIKITYWLCLSRENGNLEIYSMPDLKLVYLISNIGNGSKCLIDAMEFVPINFASNQPDSKPIKDANRHEDILNIGQSNNMTVPAVEILVTSLGNSQRNRPLLFVRTNTDLIIYHVYRYTKGHIKIRFRKIYHDVLMRKNKIEKQEINLDDDENPNEINTNKLNKMKYFENISGLNGVAICGDYPRFVFMTSRGELRVHRMNTEVTFQSFTPFNNINCPNGFVYFDETNDIKISVLPTYLTYDSTWPVRKVPLRCTPRQIQYHRENHVYCVVTQTEEETNKYFRFNGEDKELTEENKGERFIYPTASKFSVVLVTPNTWEIIPDASIDLDPWEHVTAFKIVSLAYEGTRSGLKEYLCVGTNFNYSEDITSRGKIMIYDIIEVVPEPGKPLTKFKLKEIYIKEQKGPVSAITHTLGFLVTAIGQKVYLWQLKDNDLIGVAFIDTDIYVHKIVSIKSLILIADVYKSVSILRFQEEYRTLSLVARDFQPLNVFDIEFMVDNQNLGFLVTDAEENFIIYMYQPEARESMGGQKLLRKADYHFGQRVNTMFRMQCSQNPADVRQIYGRPQFNFQNRHIVIFGTLDGALGYCLPLPEKTYRRLFMLQNVLFTHNEHIAGLNPKAFRTIRSSRKLQANPARCIVDGELIYAYLQLPFVEKIEVAKKIGTKVEELYADLKEIEQISIVF